MVLVSKNVLFKPSQFRKNDLNLKGWMSKTVSLKKNLYAKKDRGIFKAYQS